MPGPTLSEVRAKGQPPEVLARLNDEHWFGRLYMRKLSPYATCVFARLGWSPNAVTVCFMISGVAAGVLTAVPGLPAAIGVALLIQLYLLFDCSDGELARYTGGSRRPASTWTGSATTSPRRCCWSASASAPRGTSRCPAAT